MIYQNFDLEIISPQGGALSARVLESPQGDCPFVRLKWPFAAQEEHELLADIDGGLRQRRARPNRGGTIQDFGGKLFDAVFAGDIAHLFRSSLESAASAGKGLRIRLWLPEDSELHARPWELLFDTESREFLAVREHTPLVRYVPVAQPIPPMSVEGPLRILVALASPTDHPRLDIAREWEILCQALEPSIAAGRLELRRVPGSCTFDKLRDSLRHFSTHVFHFVGHGLPGALVLEQESGRGLELEATHLRSVFPSGALPRLIVLNACAGAMAEDVSLSSLAQGFLKQGVPAAVAMRASITDDAALIFTRYFYRELAETGAVDTSLTEARLRMQGNGHPIEWATPVLYMRALSGQLFRPAADATHDATHVLESVPPPPPSPGKHAPPKLEPKLEPSLDEPDMASTVQATEPLPAFKPAPEPEPAGRPAFGPTMKAAPPRDKTSYASWALIYAGAGALLAAILFLAIDMKKTPPRTDAPPAAILMPAPTAPAAPAAPAAAAPAPMDKPALPDTQVEQAAPKPREAARAPHKTQPKAKAPPARTENCKNPDVSERNANCVFQ